jgi:hypothetical protein
MTYNADKDVITIYDVEQSRKWTGLAQQTSKL